MSGTLEFEGECIIAAPRWLAWRALRNRDLFQRCLSASEFGNKGSKGADTRSGDRAGAITEFRLVDNEKTFRLSCDFDPKTEAVATALDATVVLSDAKERTRLEYKGAVVLAQHIDEQSDAVHQIKDGGIDAFFAMVAQRATGECEGVLASMASTGEIDALIPISTMVSQKGRRGRWVDLGFLAVAAVALLVVFLQVSGAFG